MEISIDDERNLVILKNRGKSTHEGVMATFEVLRIKADKDEPGNLLIDWTEFRGSDGPTQGLMHVAAQVSLMVERVAFVTHQKWQDEAAYWCRLIEDVPIEIFGVREMEDALDWLTTGST